MEAHCGAFRSIPVIIRTDFFWVLEIPDIFGVNGGCWARAYVSRKNESTPLEPDRCTLVPRFTGKTRITGKTAPGCRMKAYK